MKRKYKSGSEKRSEKKKTQILHSASAHGQTSLDSLFTKKKQKKTLPKQLRRISTKK